jgi:hypothetical protein
MNGEATPSMFAGHSMLCPYEELSVCVAGTNVREKQIPRTASRAHENRGKAETRGTSLGMTTSRQNERD